MSATAGKIAARFIGAAQKYPQQRAEIFREAAQTFMGLAQNPKNSRSAGALAKIGLDFAHHAATAQEQTVTVDDFTDLLRETAQAYHEAGDDPMELVARRREIHDERSPVDPNRMSIAPESFNRDATLGRSAKIKFAPSPEEISQGILQSQNVAFWQGTKKEAQAMTVDISLGFLPTLAVTQGETFTSTSVRPFAEVEYGSDGNRTKVKFDLSFGNRCTVVGNYIAVTIGMDPPMVNSVSTEITGGASIGTFAAPSQAPLIATAYEDFVHEGPPVTNRRLVPIPLKAVQLLPIQSNGALGSTALLEFLDYGGSLISQNFFQQAVNGQLPPIPITGDVAFVRLTNTGGPGSITNYRLPFQLGL
jgi:hypothetical protein